jgi:dTDP-4-dehydrorhamnose reductase
MKVLVTGKGGQLAWELERTAPKQFEVVTLARVDLDIADVEAVNDKFSNFRPDVVINAAAYTAVDKAESDKPKAYLTNESGPRVLAEACRNIQAKLIHVSTDFVFDGRKTSPYRTSDTPRPLGVYGASKLAGEQAVTAVLPESSLIVRTAWVYSAHGSNFVKTMLRLMTQKPSLNVVYEQVGTPTWANGLAACLWQAVHRSEVNGILHWSDAGVASWYDFAVAIQELGLEKGLLKQSIPVHPIPAASYPTPAARPAFSVLDKTEAEEALGLETVHWRRQLSAMLDDFIQSGYTI